MRTRAFQPVDFVGYWLRTPIVAYAAATVFPAAAILFVLLLGFEPADVLRDPITSAGLDESLFYLGFFSNMGVILWAMAGGICVFAAVGDQGNLSSLERSFLIYAGSMTLILAFDDMYMIHENTNEYVFYFLYAIAMSVYLLKFHIVILRLDVLVFLIAIAALGSSVVSDEIINVINHRNAPGVDKAAILEQVSGLDSPYSARNLAYLLEDGSKFIGICAWATFHIRAAYLLQRRLSE